MSSCRRLDFRSLQDGLCRVHVFRYREGLSIYLSTPGLSGPTVGASAATSNNPVNGALPKAISENTQLSAFHWP